MGSKDPRVDTYIAKSADFARPILLRIRGVVHATCPGVEETLKWGMPAFMHHGILCMMAAFKQHATMGFWKGSLVLNPAGKPADEAMGNFGRLGSVSDLPPRRELAGCIRRAMKVNEQGIKLPGRARRSKPEVAVPADFKAALAKNARARRTFQDFSPGHRREYVEWIRGAKLADTRRRRLATAIEWLALGRTQNWRYERPRAKKRVRS